MLDLLFLGYSRVSGTFMQKHIIFPATLMGAGTAFLAASAVWKLEWAEVTGWGLLVLGYPWLLLIGGTGLCLKALQQAHEHDHGGPFRVGLRQLLGLLPLIGLVLALATAIPPSALTAFIGIPLALFIVAVTMIALSGIISSLLNARGITAVTFEKRSYANSSSDEEYGYSRWDQ